MPLLTREAILTARSLPKELVPVPEWGGEVYVRGMSASERDRYVGSSMQQRGKVQTVNYQNLSAKLCVMTICDEQGKRLFTDADIAALAETSAVALQRCFDVASRLSGLDQKDIDEMTKEMEENPFSSSPTA